MNEFETALTPEEEAGFPAWKQQNAPNDSGADYDLRGAYKAKVTAGPDGHWPDTYKKPNHPTFSQESIYAKDRPDLAGHWDGQRYLPAGVPQLSAPQMEGMFGGYDKMSDALPLEQKQRMEQLLSTSSDPDGDRAEWANAAFLSHSYGKPVDEVAGQLDAYREDYARQMFHVEQPIDDKQFYARVGQMYQQQRDERGLIGEAQSKLFASFRQGEANWRLPFTAALAEMKGKPGYDPARLDIYRHVAEQQWQAWQDTGLHYPKVVDAVGSYLSASRAGKTMPEDMMAMRQQAIEQLRSVPDHDLDNVLGLASRQLAATAAATPEEIGVEKMANRLERGIGGFGIEAIRGLRDIGLRSSPVTGNLADLLDYRERTGRKLDQALAGQYDPDKGSNWLSEGVLSTGEALPRMLSMFHPVGIALNLGAFSETSRGHFEDAGVDPKKAALLGTAAAIPLTALMSVNSQTVLGKVATQGMERWMVSNISGKVGTEWVRGYAKNLAARMGENGMILAAATAGQELTEPGLQSVGHMMDATIPGIKWTGKDGELAKLAGATPQTLAQLAPLIILGTGTGMLRGEVAARHTVQNEAALRAVGLPEADVKAVLAEKTPAAAVVKLQEAWQRRQPNPVAVAEINRQLQVAAADALNPTPEPEQLKENTRLADLVGKRVQYEGYNGTLIRDEEGTFMVLREITQRGEANRVEVADTGKAPDLLAHEVGVVPENGFDRKVETAEPTAGPRASLNFDGSYSVKDRAGNVTGETASVEMAAKAIADEGKASARAASVSPEQTMANQEAGPAQEAIYGPEQPHEAAAPVPSPSRAAAAVSGAADEIKRLFAPQTRTPEAREAAGMLREHGATLAQRTDRAVQALKGARKVLGQMTPADRLAFVDRVETGQKQPSPVLDGMAKVMREILDTKREEIRALGTGKLEHFIEDYFPHIWEDPEAAASVFKQAAAKGPLEGGKSFLKQRTIPTTREGIEMGLKPVSDNPVDLVLLKAREMDKYITAQRVMKELDARGLVKFVRATEKMPDGLARIDDKISQVYGPPTIEVPEYVDKVVRTALDKVMENLGIAHERTGTMKKGALGLSFPGKSEIETKGGTEMSVVAHEVGHQIDEKLGLGAVINNAGRAKELKALAGMRGYKSAEQKAYAMQPNELTAAALEAYIGAKERFREVAPNTLAALEKFIDAHPELAPLKDLKPSIQYERQTFDKPHGGLLKLGEYAAPEPVATVINNYLSPGLRGSQLFRNYLTAANSLNQFQLGLSAFHLGFTSLDTSISKFALGLQHAMDGNVAEAAKSIGGVPAAPLTNLLKGDKVLKEWYSPGSQGEEVARIVDALRQGGGRAKMDSFYVTNLTQKMVESFRQGGPAGLWGATWRAPFAVIEQAAKPIMEYIVPRQKLGIFAEMARRELAALPAGANQADVRLAMGKAWDSVDNRMGQVVYDNLFWNKAAKDLGMASVRSLGWNLGTLRELGGGALDAVAAGKAFATAGQKPEFTHRMAYTIALPIMTGMIGGFTQYMLTGKAPEELKDYFFPKTGENDPQGRPIRLSLPSYMKDIYHYAHDPVGTVEGKVHPAISGIMEMLNNKDYFGRPIRNSDDPVMKQLLDTAVHVGASFEPIGVGQFFQSRDSGQSTPEMLSNFLGIIRAAKWVSMSKAEQLAQQLASENYGSKAAPEKKATTDTGKVMLKLRSPDVAERSAGLAELERMVKAGDIQARQAGNLVRSSRQTFLVNQVAHLDAQAALRVFAAGTPEEQKEIHDLIAGKIARAQVPAADKEEMTKKLGGKPARSAEDDGGDGREGL